MTSVAVVALLATGTCVFAQGPGRRDGRRTGPAAGFGGPMRGARAFGFMARDLNLSDAQRQQIRAITQKAREDSRPLAERLAQAADARRKAMTATPVDDNQIRATTQALTTAETDMAIARAHVRGDIFAVLTPDQQAKVTAAQTARETRMKERRDRMQQRRQQRSGTPAQN
jgi:Spy/CpxP family protein refolding chaperone